MSKTMMRAVVALLLIVAIGVAIHYREAFDVASLQAWVDGFGIAGPLVFMLVYALATVLFLPGSAITLAGGAIFGPLWGTLYNLTGATIGATIAFLIARYLAADWAEQKSGGRVKQLKEGVEAEGWRFVAFVRLVPLFPFNALNYALGLTRIRLAHYIITSYLCMLPGAIAYTYLGYAGREAVAGGEGMIQKGLLALALLALVAFLPRLIGRLRQGPKMAVAELQQSTDNYLILDVRSEAEFVGPLGHIDGAINIPVEVLAERIGELERYRERPIAIVCRTDVRSAKAAQLLAKQGFAELHVVRDGMTAWNGAGYAVVGRNEEGR
ncbi:MAG: VTT domain-containing protein [Chromatiales bacterium]|nr:VTT domain-containing protein [Chromatiales bacterium]